MTLLRELVLDTKGVRRVRTPAGVRYYGQPIGTIITRDLRDAAKKRHKAPRRKTSRDKARTAPNRPKRGSGDSGRGSGGSSDSLHSMGQRLHADTPPSASNKRPTITVNPVKKQQWVGSERRDYSGYQAVADNGWKGKIHWTSRGRTGARSNARAEGEQYLRDWDEKNPPEKPKNVNTEPARRYNEKEYAAADSPSDPSYLRWKSPEASRALREMPMGGKIKYVDLNGDEKTLEKAPGQAPWDTPFLKDEDGKFYNGAGRMPWTTLMREQSLNNVVHFPHLAKEDKPKPDKPKETLKNIAKKPADNKNVKVGDRVRFRTKARGREEWAEGTVTAVVPASYRGEDGKDHEYLDITVRRDGAKRGVRTTDKYVEKLDSSEPKDKPATKKKPIAPSKDTKEYIDEMRGFHDKGMPGWNAHLGSDRKIAWEADRMADKYDKNAERIAEINQIEEDSDDGMLPEWLAEEADDLVAKNEAMLPVIEALNNLAELDRDLTADDIPDILGRDRDANLVLFAIRHSASLNNKTPEEEIANYLNLATVSADTKTDSNGKIIPPEGLLDAHDDFLDLGKVMQREIREHMDNDPDVQAARKFFNDIDGDDPKPMTFRDRENEWRSLDYMERARLMGELHKETTAWYARRGLNNDAIADVVEFEKRKAFDEERKKKLLEAERRMALAERNVKLAYLNNIRPMGGHKEANPGMLDFDTESNMHRRTYGEERGSKETWDDLFNQSVAVFPTSWLAAMPDKYYKRAWADRAFNMTPASVGTDGQTLDGKGQGIIALHTPGHRSHPELDTSAFGNYEIEVSAHEIGHSMETFVPGLAMLEWSHLYERSGRHLPNGEWEAQKHIEGAESHENAMNDEWKRSYAGKVYIGGSHANHEMFTTTIQDVFGRSYKGKIYTKEEDDRAEQLILAAMATLHYYEDEEDYRK